jgi:hypothetical protein
LLQTNDYSIISSISNDESAIFDVFTMGKQTFPSLQELEKQDIKPIRIIQNANEGVIAKGICFHMGWSLETGVAEAINFLPLQFMKHGIEELITFYNWVRWFKCEGLIIVSKYELNQIINAYTITRALQHSPLYWTLYCFQLVKKDLQTFIDTDPKIFDTSEAQGQFHLAWDVYYSSHNNQSSLQQQQQQQQPMNDMLKLNELIDVMQCEEVIWMYETFVEKQ